MRPHIVFDFDGTIADSRSVFLLCYNNLAAKYGFVPITDENLHALKKLTMIERFRHLKVPLFWLPLLTRKFLRDYHQHAKDIPFMPGIEKLLSDLKESDYNISILSSNSEKTISAFLEANSVKCVSGIYSSGKLFRKDRLLLKFIRKQGLAKTGLIYICDELRDVEACKKAGIPVIWVSWGFEEIGVFGKQPPEHIAHSPAELWQIIHSAPLK